MKKAAVFLAPGFEEIEALTVVDVLRRAGVSCETVRVPGVDETSGVSNVVIGAHEVPVVTDRLISENLPDYDLIVFPGGLPGATNLRDNELVIERVQTYAADPDKKIAAICAAPMVFAKAGVTRGHRLTSYPGFEDLFADALYLEEAVVVDGNMITSRGPATALPFAYALAEALGCPVTKLKEAMLYQ